MKHIDTNTVIHCECGNACENHSDTARHKFDGFELVQYLDGHEGGNNRAIYKCDQCNQLTVSFHEVCRFDALKVLSISTAHVTQQDMEQLTIYAHHGCKDLPVRMFTDEHGTMIHCVDPKTCDEMLSADAEDALDELSEEFWNIYRAACHSEWDYLLLDADSGLNEEDGWPVFEW